MSVEVTSKEKSIAPVKGGYTPSKQVLQVSPIMRVRRGVSTSHETNFLFEGSTKKISLPLIEDKRRFIFVDPFESIEERKWLEKELGQDLNPNNPADKNFFVDYRVVLGKTDEDLHMDNPHDLLMIRVLQANKDLICTTTTARIEDLKIEYMYTLGPKGVKFNRANLEAETKASCFDFYIKNKDNADALKAILRLMGETLTVGSSLESLRTSVYKKIEEDPFRFFEVINDKDRPYKLLFDLALQYSAIFITDEGIVMKGSTTPIAETKHGAIEFFKDPKNSLEVNKIKAYINQAKDGV